MLIKLKDYHDFVRILKGMDYEDLTTYCLQIGSNYLNLEGKTPIITSSSLRNKNGTTWRETP